MKINFAEACENTFIIIDKLSESSLTTEETSFIIDTLREKNRDDALILIEGKSENDVLTVKMLVLGQDGMFGEFCGNGARACAAYLYKNYLKFDKFIIKTREFNHKLSKLENGWFSVSMPKVSFDIDAKFIQGQLCDDLIFVNAVEPHLALLGLFSDQELFIEGQRLNNQKQIFPLGINLNAFYPIDSDTIKSKTYERGVQRLTKSCGTGSLSCAAVFLKSQNKDVGSVNVITPGGPLKVLFNSKNIELQGPAIA